MTTLASPQTATYTATTPGEFVTVTCATGDEMLVSWVGPGGISGRRTVLNGSDDIGPLADNTVVTFTARAGNPQYTAPGSPASAVSGDRNLLPPPGDYPIHSIRLTSPLLQLDLPSPYFPALTNTKEHAYGTPIYIHSGLGGYRWWMVAAPYPTQASNLGGVSPNKFENPTIYCSDDGINFIQPPGIAKNPIFDSRDLAENSGNSYYADPMISASPDGKKMYVVWCHFQRLTGAIRSSLLISESTDGINWTAPVSVYDSTSTTFLANTPSLLWNGAGWTVVMIDTRDGTGTFTINRMTTASATPYSGWSAWSTCVATHPLSRNWWHMHCVALADNVIVAMAADNGSNGGQAYTLKSSDGGANWSAQPFSYINTVSPNGSWYRPGLCAISKPGSPLEMRLYVSRIAPIQQSGFWMQTGTLATDAPSILSARASSRDMVSRAVAPALLKGSLLAWDSFTRADSASTLGNAESGQTWIMPSSPWGISTNRAYTPSTANCIAVVDVGASDYEIEIQMLTYGSTFALVWAYQDSNNFLRFGSPNGIQRIAGGGVAQTYNNPTSLNYSAYPSGTVFGLIKRGLYHTLMIDDKVVDTFKDTNFASATKVGFQANGASPSIIDQFIVRNVA